LKLPARGVVEKPDTECDPVVPTELVLWACGDCEKSKGGGCDAWFWRQADRLAAA